jgi:hypothetical protein
VKTHRLLSEAGASVAARVRQTTFSLTQFLVVAYLLAPGYIPVDGQQVP